MLVGEVFNGPLSQVSTYGLKLHLVFWLELRLLATSSKMDWYAFSGERPLGRSAVNLWHATGLDYLVPLYVLLRILLYLILANRFSFKNIGPSPRTFSATGLDRKTAMRFASQETTDNRDIQRFNVMAPCIMCTEINVNVDANSPV